MSRAWRKRGGRKGRGGRRTEEAVGGGIEEEEKEEKEEERRRKKEEEKVAEEGGDRRRNTVNVAHKVVFPGGDSPPTVATVATIIWKLCTGVAFYWVRHGIVRKYCVQQ